MLVHDLTVYFIFYSLLINVFISLFGIFIEFITVDVFISLSVTVHNFYFYALYVIVSPLGLHFLDHQRYTILIVRYTKTVRAHAPELLVH